MPTSRLPFAVAGVGLFLAAAAVGALAANATAPAIACASLAALHLLVAALAGGSRPVAILGGLLGLLELAVVGIGLWFVLGILDGIGRVDPGLTWVAPLNGYGTVAVAGAIVVVAIGLTAQAVGAVRGSRQSGGANA